MSARSAPRVAVITGGATGIGAAITRQLSEEGTRVAVCGLAQEPIDLLCDTLRGAGRDVAGWTADVGNERQVEDLMGRVIDRFGGLDILVNCAGTSAVGPLESTSLETWQRVIDTNLTGVFLMSRAAIPHLRARGQGVIVNVASQLAFSAVAGFAAYCASKAAVVHLTRSLALEVISDGIRVNVVCPGAVDTSLLRSAFPDGRSPQGTLEDLVAAHPIGRLGTPEEIAGAVCWLVSGGSTFVVGAALVVDGGYTLP